MHSFEYILNQQFLGIIVGRKMKTGRWVILFTLSPTEGGWRNVLLTLKAMIKLLLVTKHWHSGWWTRFDSSMHLPMLIFWVALTIIHLQLHKILKLRTYNKRVDVWGFIWNTNRHSSLFEYNEIWKLKLRLSLLGQQSNDFVYIAFSSRVGKLF